MRVCVVYDCLYPYTVGGAERWYRDLAEELHRRNHSVTYLTLRQWPRGQEPEVSSVDVVAVGPRLELYTRRGRRRILPPLVFGVGVLVYLLRHGRRTDVVHMGSFPYFSLLAAALVRPFGRYRIFVDWHEVWTREYWSEYLGPIGGPFGWMVQRLCVGVPQRAFCFSDLHARRLRELGLTDVVRLAGFYREEDAGPAGLPVTQTVVFAGRHIPEKNVGALVPALARARERAPELRAELYGDGPERPALLRAIDEQGLGEAIDAPGFVDAERVRAAIASALCLVLPSRREGFGRVVLEAAASGTPSVVVAGSDNAAVELVEDGANGFVAPSASPDDLAAAIVRVRDAGEELRRSTRTWFAANADRLSFQRSIETVCDRYEQ